MLSQHSERIHRDGHTAASQLAEDEIAIQGLMHVKRRREKTREVDRSDSS